MKYHVLLRPVRCDSGGGCCSRIEAQTLANVYLALDNDLEILPIINKIDLPAADPERVRQEIEDVIGLDLQKSTDISQGWYWYRGNLGTDRGEGSSTDW